MDAEIIATIRERIAALEQRAEDLEERIKSGDKSVRQGVEVVKDIALDLRAELRELESLVRRMSKEILGQAGQKALQEELKEIKQSLLSLKEWNENHELGHAGVAGKQSVWQSWKQQYAAPIITGIIVAIPTIVLGIIALSR